MSAGRIVSSMGPPSSRPSRILVEKKRSRLGGPRARPKNCTEVVWTRYGEFLFLYFSPTFPVISTIKLSRNGSTLNRVFPRTGLIHSTKMCANFDLTCFRCPPWRTALLALRRALIGCLTTARSKLSRTRNFLAWISTIHQFWLQRGHLPVCSVARFGRLL